MGNMGGKGSHLIVDSINSDCMKSQGMGIIRFCGIFGKVMGRGRGRERGKLLYLYRVKVSGGGGGGEPDSDH